MCKLREQGCCDPATLHSPLHSAVIYQRETMVEVLLEKQVDPLIIDKSGKQALHLAVREQNPRIVESIANHLWEIHGLPPAAGIDTANGFNALHYAAKFCLDEETGPKIVDSLLKFKSNNEEGPPADLLTKSFAGETPLEVGATHDNAGVVSALLDAIDVSGQDRFEESQECKDRALALAAAHGSERVALMLIQDGCNVFQRVPWSAGDLGRYTTPKTQHRWTVLGMQVTRAWQKK